MIDIINSVPFGQDNAQSARDIWRALDCWAEPTVADHLNRLSEAGAVKRVRQPTFGIAFRWIYYREDAAA